MKRGGHEKYIERSRRRTERRLKRYRADAARRVARQQALDQIIDDLTPKPKPKEDYWTQVAEHMGISRAAAKHMGFGNMYGMSAQTLTKYAGITTTPKREIMITADYAALELKAMAYGMIDAKTTHELTEKYKKLKKKAVPLLGQGPSVAASPTGRSLSLGEQIAEPVDLDV